MKTVDSRLRIKVAKLNPYQSVVKTCLNEPINQKTYLGVKNVPQIPFTFIKRLEEQGNYVLHTLDSHSWGGRAIDIKIKNPITGRFMSGSSSGTAVNVRCYINDIGIGTDGGGSVLAPAMAVNLFGFISNLIEEEEMKKHAKKSTDGINFTPSIGFMSRDFETLNQLLDVVFPDMKSLGGKGIFIDERDTFQYPFDTQKIKMPDRFGERNLLIEFLNHSLKECDFLISYEGPVDLEGIGDTIFGHFDERCHEMQRKSNKGLLRVVNMVNATAICIPDTALSCGWVCICESKLEKIAYMLEKVKQLVQPEDQLLESYFSNLSMYLEK